MHTKFNSLLCLILFAALFIGCKNQNSETRGDKGMNDFAKSTSFKEQHNTDRQIELGEEGEMVEFETPDGKTTKAFEIKPEGDPKSTLLVIHEWWGLNDFIKAESQRYAKLLGGVHVLALDLYDGKVAETREQASSYMQSVKDERAKAIIQGALAYSSQEVPVGTIGWCFGGGWSLKASIEAGERSKACVIYYGMPVKTASELAPLTAPVFGVFATNDQWINEKVVADFNALCKATGKDFTYESFDAAHAFANPSNSRYDDEAAQKANQKTLEFLQNNLSD